jgi:hypothetical protein
MPSKATYVGTAVSVVGLVLTIWFAFPHTPDLTERRLQGALSSVIAGTHSLQVELALLAQFSHPAREDNGPDISFTGQQVVLPDNTAALQRLVDDPELFQRLSEPLQQRLSRFIQTRTNVLSALNPKKPDLHQGGGVRLLRLHLDAEQVCFDAEMKFQRGQIGKSDVKNQIEAAMHVELRQVMRGQPVPDGAELGPSVPMFIPDAPNPKAPEKP